MMGASPSETPTTIRDALRRGVERLRRAGVRSAALEMSLILAHVLQTDRLGIYTNPQRTMTAEEQDAVDAMLARRLRAEPMAYLLGEKEFHGLRMNVTADVLIPRPETELLVDTAVAWLQSLPEDREPPLLADIGAGSGAIAVAAAHACRRGRWIATDASGAALEVARRNAQAHGVADRIEFRQGSLFDPIAETLDAICSNPPYVAEKDRCNLPAEVARWEPPQALYAGADGLDYLRPIAEGAGRRLRAGGLLLLECGQGQAKAVAAMVRSQDEFAHVETLNDLAGIARLVRARTAG